MPSITTEPVTTATGELSAPRGERRREVPLRKRIFRMLLLALGIYLGFCAAIAWQTVRPKTAKLLITPESVKLDYEPVSFRSKDGTTLRGWFVRASSKPRGVIVLCHGVDSDRVAMLSKAEMLHKAGFASLLFDFRGRGESDPVLCTIGYRETDDLLAGIDYVRGRKDCVNVPLGVLGESQGGAVALMGTARSKNVAAVVAESPFACLDNAVNNHFGKVFGGASPLVAFPVKLMGELLIRQRCCNVAPVDEITRIAPRPVLLIQDADDLLCPPSETAELSKAAGRSATLWTVPNADHICAEVTEPDEYRRRIVTFFEKHL